LATPLAAIASGVSHAVAKHDVEHEARAIREGEQEAERLTGELNSGQHGDAADREPERDGVAAGANTRGGQHDGSQELDRADARQRQPGDCQVEQRVHGGQYHAHREEEEPLARAGLLQDPPGTAPQSEDDRRRSDAQPSDTQRRDVDEQQRRQCWAEVMKYRARQEERGGRQPADRASDWS